MLASLPVSTFISVQHLENIRRLPRALRPFGLDSQGYQSITRDGYYRRSAKTYTEVVRRLSVDCGQLVFASIQDWMCEAEALRCSGLTVAEHQRRTVESWMVLRDIDASLPWVPVLQGYHPEDYLRCLDLYFGAGQESALLRAPAIGVGSVCRRQRAEEGADIFWRLVAEWPALRGRLHAFGFKITGLRMIAPLLGSSDSMSWSREARYAPALPECHVFSRHKNCANCQRFALRWREMLVLDPKIGPYLDEGSAGVEPLRAQQHNRQLDLRNWVQERAPIVVEDGEGCGALEALCVRALGVNVASV